MSNAKSILVTGANKGIGYGIARSLLTQSPPGSTVYLTSRDPTRGEKAASSLIQRPEGNESHTTIGEEVGGTGGTKLVYHQLDTEDLESIDKMMEYVKKQQGGKLDVLINNASVALDPPGSMGAGKKNVPGLEEAEKMININYYGTLNMWKAFLPLIPPQGRVVNVSSVACHLKNFSSPSLVSEITSPSLDIPKLTALVESYLTLLRAGIDPSTHGWPNNCYSVTKAAVTALTAILAREHPDKLINSCCPGWVDTDMGSKASGAGKRPPKSIDEGARIPVRLAVGDAQNVSGAFWENKSISDKGYGMVSVW